MKPSKDLFPLSRFTSMVNGGITAEEKRRLCALFVRFVLSDFNENIWKKSKALYQSLSSMHGQIAHYNASGFYASCFGNDVRRLEYLRFALESRFYGDPDYTRVDMERALAEWIAQSDVIARLETRILDDMRARDLAELARLTVKYGPAADSAPDMLSTARQMGKLVIVPIGAPTSKSMAKRLAIQAESPRPVDLETDGNDEGEGM